MPISESVLSDSRDLRRHLRGVSRRCPSKPPLRAPHEKSKPSLALHPKKQYHALAVLSRKCRLFVERPDEISVLLTHTWVQFEVAASRRFWQKSGAQAGRAARTGVRDAGRRDCYHSGQDHNSEEARRRPGVFFGGLQPRRLG